MLQNKMFRCIPLLCVFKVCSVIKMANKLCECTYFLTFINLQKEKRVIIMNQKKVTLRGELALLIVILINSMGVVLMLRSGSGISAISSVPYAFSLVFPTLTLGTWTYIFQGLLVLSLMILKKRFVPSYLFSFVAGFAFGKMVDIHEIWINTVKTLHPKIIRLITQSIETSPFLFQPFRGTFLLLDPQTIQLHILIETQGISDTCILIRSIYLCNRRMLSHPA